MLYMYTIYVMFFMAQATGSTDVPCSALVTTTFGRLEPSWILEHQ